MPVPLTATEYGDGPPVAILHGVFGAGRNWASVARELGRHHRVIAFDLRNHGASPWAATMSYREMAADVHAAMRERGHHRYAVLGHSMGGKTAMVLALTQPAAVERLVVVDIAPIAYPVPFLDHIRAMRELDLGAVVRRRDADTRLAAAIPDPAERTFLLQNLGLGDGAPRWRLNLAAIAAAMPALAAFPDFPPGTGYDGPALFIGGARSHVLGPEAEPVITALFPHAALAWVPGAGHWVQADQPAAFLARVGPFLAAEQGARPHSAPPGDAAGDAD